jgi:hypothetical protein
MPGLKGRGLSIPALRFEIHHFRGSVDQGKGRTSKGNGLGVALVDADACAHCGSVEVDNRPGVGALIKVNLPISDAKRIIHWRRSHALIDWKITNPQTRCGGNVRSLIDRLHDSSWQPSVSFRVSLADEHGEELPHLQTHKEEQVGPQQAEPATHEPK